MADIGGCSANEATSFASVSVAKRLCRIVRVVGYEVAVSKVFIKDNAAAAATPHPLPFGYCVFQHKQNAAFPLIRLAIARHLLPREKASIVVLLVSSKTMKQQDHIAPSKQPPKGFSLRRSCQRELTDEV